MMEKYKTYSRYKDSEDERLSYIPQSWDRKKLKFLAKIKNGQDYKSIEVDTGYPVLGSGGQFTASSKYLYDRPSVLLGRKGTVDKPIYIDEPFWTVDTMYYTEIKNEIPEKFFYYLCLTIPFGKYITSTALPSMTQENLSNNIFYIPINYEEKQNIANFLDYETSKMDMMIEKQQQLIKLLEEKRQAVISHAVTKGLNPNVSMKDSGVEWLGEIPEHWQTVAIGRLFDRVKRTGYAEKELLSVYRDYGVIPKSSRDDNFNKSSQDLSSYQLVNPNDLVINKMKTWQGSIAISNYEGIVSPAYFIFKPNKKMYSHFITKYIHYLLRTPIYVSQYLARSKGIRVNQWDLDPEEFRKIKLVIPTKNEQLQSIEYIEKYEEKINKLISKAIQQINLLKERRTALISAAVTGKIDVRDWQAPTVTD